MGLDILIETRNTKERKTCHLSRQFCREMVNQVEDSTSIINQIIDGYEVNRTFLDKMNVWDLEKDFFGDSVEISKEEIERRYEMAWQSSADVLDQLRTLREGIEQNKKVLKIIDFKDEMQEGYYTKHNPTENNEKGLATFTNDLENIIHFLEKLPENEHVN